jgi:transcriptional regulator with XRE-family HTH domain
MECHRLRLTRLALDISEADAAATYGVTLPTYRKWENGGRIRPSHRVNEGTLAFVLKYNVSLDWLICGSAFTLNKNLTSRAPGKVAILPVITVKQRREREAAAAFWRNRA